MRQFMKTVVIHKNIIPLQIHNLTTRAFFFLWTVPCGIVCMEEKKTVAQYIIVMKKLHEQVV